jgi:hypothetical protein
MFVLARPPHFILGNTYRREMTSHPQPVDKPVYNGLITLCDTPLKWLEIPG